MTAVPESSSLDSPASAEAWHMLGLVASQAGDFPRAVDALRAAVEIAPQRASLHSDLALALRRSNRLSEARAALSRALELEPGCALAHLNLAALERGEGAYPEAAIAYRRAVDADPRRIAAWSGLGACLAELDRLVEAIDALERALVHHPGDARLSGELAELRIARAGQLVRQHRAADAVPLLEAALAHRPEDPMLHCKLGAALRLADHRAASIAQLRATAQRWPACADAWNDLATALQEAGSIDGDDALLDDADRCYLRAAELAPERWTLAFNLALLRLLRGDLARGFSDYDARWRDGSDRLAAYPAPLWRGEPLGGRTLLLHAEQGLGDTLQFVRYAELARARGARVVLQCQKPLRALLGGCRGVDQLIDESMPVPAFDVHAPLLGLPAILGTTLETIPSRVPYILPDPELIASWRHRLRGHRGMRVGIAWQGNPAFPRDHWRSVPLACFEPVARVPGVALFSLQVGHGREQLAAAPASWNITDCGLAFEDTAALMTQLDVVVTTDTSVAHLAGALGRPVWLAVSSTPDWRWLLGRTDSPWYPTMRLFRQRDPADWSAVFHAIASSLAAEDQLNTT